MHLNQPRLDRVVSSNGVVLHTDTHLSEVAGVRVAFTERLGGTSQPPYHALNLAGHVGDEPVAVDENRIRMLSALGASRLDMDRLTLAEQVHGIEIRVVDDGSAGSGGRVSAAADSPPIPATDALITLETGVPLLMCFADCVPVILVTAHPRRAIAVVHAGWRGALAGLPGKAVAALIAAAGADPAQVRAYIGPHICPACFHVADEVARAFAERWPSAVLSKADAGTCRAVYTEPVRSDTIRSAPGRVPDWAAIDLRAVVTADLNAAGLTLDSIVASKDCTAGSTDRFYSYRAEGVTGRHGAVAVLDG